jgi:hypothetical protein
MCWTSCTEDGIKRSYMEEGPGLSICRIEPPCPDPRAHCMTLDLKVHLVVGCWLSWVLQDVSGLPSCDSFYYYYYY